MWFASIIYDPSYIKLRKAKKVFNYETLIYLESYKYVSWSLVSKFPS